MTHIMMDQSEGERLVGDEVGTQAILGALITRIAQLSNMPADEIAQLHEAARKHIESVQLHGVAPFDPVQIKKFAAGFVANTFRAVDMP